MPRRSRSEALNVETLSLLAQASRLTEPEVVSRPATIGFERAVPDARGHVLIVA